MSYSETLRAYSPAVYNDNELECTGRVLLPESALNEILGNEGQEDKTPMQFAFTNPTNQAKLYAGVKSFTTEQGHVCMPYWMMRYLGINEGDPLRVSIVKLPKATQAVFQPQDSEFNKISNPKVILEYTLRSHNCLTQGSIIPIDFNNKKYQLKVLKTSPEAAVSIYNADVAVDFATPVDQFDHHWNEPDTDSSDEDTARAIVTGVARTLSGKIIHEKPKPMHSTFEQREADRLAHRNQIGIKRFEDGKEILPPKPKEDVHKKKPKRADDFQGNFHTLKPSSTAQPQDTKPDTKAPKKAEAPKPKDVNPPSNPFSGTGHSLKGEVIPPSQHDLVSKKLADAASHIEMSKPKAEEGKKKPEKPAKEEDPFKGKARSLGRPN